MRIIRAPDHLVSTDERGQNRKGPLLDLEADPALTGEVLARLEQHVGAESTEALCLLVEAFEPKRCPSAARLQEHHPQVREALEGSEADELGASQHLLEAVAHRVQNQGVERAV